MRSAKAAAPKSAGRRRASANSNGPSHQMNGFTYVYILESLAPEGSFYVGLTDDLSSRLARNDSGGVPHTAKRRPWRSKTAVAFQDRGKAAAFEKYLKSPSGRAFSKKRL